MQVRVWNDNSHPFKQLFRGQNIDIPPKKFIMMEHEQADLFLGEFSPILRDADGQQLVSSYKMLRIEKNSKEQVPLSEEWLCHSCGHSSVNEVDLEEHISAHHVDEMIDEDEVKKRRK